MNITQIRNKLEDFNKQFGYSKYKIRAYVTGEFAIDVYSKIHGLLKTKKAYIHETDLDEEVNKIIMGGM